MPKITKEQIREILDKELKIITKVDYYWGAPCNETQYIKGKSKAINRIYKLLEDGG